MASGHIVASFDEDLAELNTMLARLGGLAEKQFADAMDALERRDIQNIDEIIARDANSTKWNLISMSAVLRSLPCVHRLRGICGALS